MRMKSSPHLTLGILSAFVTVLAHPTNFGRSLVPELRSVCYAGLPDLYEASIAELRAGLEAGDFTSVDLVKAYLARIDEVNLRGPALRAVLETNPSALAQAAELDKQRQQGKPKGPLHGIPILVKDNIATLPEEGMNTTAGSYALLGSKFPRDAHVAAKLREAGAIILGKAAMSEWAYFRGSDLPSGWSGRGGQCTNAYFPGGNPSGSSGGSGVAASIGLCAAALGTETDGSIISPCQQNNLVGIKPTVGLTSRSGVIPISSHQDTVGPMARSVADAALLLSAIAGPDQFDNATSAQPTTLPDYTAALDLAFIKSARIGVPRSYYDEALTESGQHVKEAFEGALRVLKALGAVVLDPADIESTDQLSQSDYEATVLGHDFKAEIATYLSSLVSNPSGALTLADLIAFNDKHTDLEKPPTYESQSVFLESESTSSTSDPVYLNAIENGRIFARTQGIDAALEKHNLTALVMLAGETSLPAVAGYPIVTVPLGFYPNDTAAVPVGNHTVQTYDPHPNRPFGIQFVGTAFSEVSLISLAYAFEQATHHRLEKLAYPAAIPKTQLADVLPNANARL